MRLRFTIVILASLPWSLPAQNGSVAALFKAVQSALHEHRPDRDIAQIVDTTRLAEKLGDDVVEELQSEGAGPETMDALDRAQEASRKLPKPAAPLPLFDAPEAPSADEQSKAIEKTRDIAMQYTANLPNFLCTETVHRFFQGKNETSWKRRDVLTMDVAYTEKGEQYKLQTIDGHPTNKKMADVGGALSNGEFGSLLKMIFDPKSATEFRWERWTRLRNRLTLVVAYHIPQKHSSYTISWITLLKNYRGKFAVSGAVYIDRETSQVMRFSDEAEGIPNDWPILGTPAVLEYDYADIGGNKFLLPKRVDSRVLMKSGQNRNRVEFGNYRRFSSEATVSFDK